MNPAKTKIDSLRSSAKTIAAANRRKIVEEDLRPTLESLKCDGNHFKWEQERFLQQVNVLKMWATEIWKKKDGEAKVGKFLSELVELEAQLKP